MGTHQIHNFRLRFGELSKVDPQQTCHFIFITQNKHAAFFFNSPELKITHVWLLVSLWTGTVVVLLFWSSYVCFVCFLGLCLFCFSFLFFIFSLHTCLVCLISPALLPEFFPRPLSLHTCAASPSLAPPSSQCSSMCYLRLFVFKSSLFYRVMQKKSLYPNLTRIQILRMMILKWFMNPWGSVGCLAKHVWSLYLSCSVLLFESYVKNRSYSITNLSVF